MTGGMYYTVRWRTNYTGELRPWYSTDGGSTWVDMWQGYTINAQAKELQWTAPDNVNSNTCLFYLESADTWIYDQSTRPFAIHTPVFKVNVPNGGEKFYEGKTYPVRWSTNWPLAGVVDIYYSTGAPRTWMPVVKDVSSTSGKYDWTIPTGVNSNTCKVMAYLRTSIRNMLDTSDHNFTISPNMAIATDNNSLQLYPNPATDGKLTLQSSELKGSSLVIAEIINARNQLKVAEGKYMVQNDRIVVDVSKLVKGDYYILKTVNKDGKIVSRLFKKE